MGRLSNLAMIRRAVCERAEGECEQCGVFVGYDGDLGHLDHFFGRKHAPETAETCWLLCIKCDESKTLNKPSAAWWSASFQGHCARYGYEAERERAATRLAVLAAKFPGSTP